MMLLNAIHFASRRAARKRDFARRIARGRAALRVIASVSGAALVALPAARAATKTWTGSVGNTDWATGANWGGTAPATGDSLVFTSANASGTSLLTNNLTATAFSIVGITFNAGSPAYAMTGNTFTLGASGIVNNSSQLQTFSNAGGLSLSASPAFNVSNVGGIAITGGVVNTVVGNVTLTANGSGGLLTLGGFDLASAASGNVVRTDAINGAGNVTINGAVTASGGATALTSGLTYSGTGTLTLTGATASTYTGGTTVNSGTEVLDFSSLATPTNLIASSSPLSLAGGNLVIKGQSGAAATSQTFGNLGLNAGGASTITLNPNGGAGTTLTLGNAFNRNPGGSVLNVNISAGGTLATTLSAGTLGYATVRDATGLGFARATGTGIVRLTGLTTLAANSNSSTTDYVTSGSTTLTGAATLDTLSIDTSATSGTLDLGGNALGFTQKALLMTGANNFTIQNGQLGANGVELIVHQMGTGVLTINSPISNGAALLTTDGPGTTVLTSTNAYTGATSVEGGTLNLTGSLTGGTQISVALGATFTESSAASISGAAKITSSGTTTLAGTNTYTGGTTINAGITKFATINSMPATGTVSVQNNKFNPAVLAVNAGGAGEFTNAATGNGSIGALFLKTNTGSTGFGGQGAPVNFGFFSAIGIDTTNAGGSFTYANVIPDVTGTFGLTKLGSGTLVLNAANTYSGITNINGGILQATVSGNTSASLGNGGTITFTGGTLQYGGTNTQDYSNTRIRFSTSPIAIDTNGNNVAFANTLDATNIGGLTKSGTGNLTLTGANAYTGTTTIGGGTLIANAADVPGTSGALGNGGAVTFAGGVLQYGTGITQDYSSRITGSTGAISLDTNGNNVTYASPLNNTNTGGLSKKGAGTLTLSGANSYSGATGLTAGTLQFAKTASMSATSAITLGSGNTFTPAILAVNVGGSGEFTSATSGNGSIGGLLSGLGGQSGSTVTYNLGSSLGLDTTNAAGTVTYAGIIGDQASGAFGIVKSGTGTLTLSGANTYTGTTVVAGGTLIAGGTVSQNTSAALGNGANITFTGGTLQYGGANTYDYSPRIRFSSAPIAIHTGGANVAYATALNANNTGGLTKTGTGTLTLAAANAYLGATTVGGGTLAVSNNNALSIGAVVLNGGTLAASASNLTVTAVSGTADTLRLAGTSVLDFGSGLTNNAFKFANSSAVAWTGGAALSVYNYVGNPGNVGGTVGDGFDHLFVGADATGLLASQLQQIQFFADAGSTSLGFGRILSTGEVVGGGAAAPEPAALALLGVGMLGAMGAGSFAGRVRRGMG